MEAEPAPATADADLPPEAVTLKAHNWRTLRATWPHRSGDVMTTAWPALLGRIHTFAAQMSDLRAEYPAESDFFAAFAGIAAGIQDDADRVGEDTSESAWILLHNLLVDHGWLPQEQRQM